MDVSFECTVSLSKKLRAIIGDSDSRVVLVTDSLRQGKGLAKILVSGENLNLNAANQMLGDETSIQFIPTSMKNEVPSVEAVANIFSTAATHVGPRTAVNRLAVTEVPEKHQRAYAVKRQEEIDVPKEFPEYKEPEFQSFVSNLQELTMAIKAAQGKTSDIIVDEITDPRQKALALQRWNQLRSLRCTFPREPRDP